MGLKDCTRHVSNDNREVLGQRIHFYDIPELLTCVLKLSQLLEQLLTEELQGGVFPREEADGKADEVFGCGLDKHVGRLPGWKGQRWRTN